MEILKQMEAKTKGFDIINSCCTAIQLNGAERYIKLYYDLFEDLIGKSELEYQLKEQHIKILNNKKT